MISLSTALELKAAGLHWVPAILDFFAIPDRSMDDKVFVISDMLVTVDLLQGLQVVSFQGASEWALDSLVTTDAVWLPSEAQLRQTLESALLEAGLTELRLVAGLNGCRCEFMHHGELHSFEDQDASEAYAAGLLYLLKRQGRRDKGSAFLQ
jgi:hypothetical protein